jgi:hypothetical protein
VATRQENDAAVLRDANQRVSAFTIGFVLVDAVNGRPLAQCAGSGTLVQLGQQCGIVTAAHVTAQFSRRRHIGLLLYEQLYNRRVQALRFSKSDAQFYMIGPGRFRHGPDLAFVHLPDDAIRSLRARASFFNLNKRREAVVSGELMNRRKYFDCVAGTVDQHSSPVANAEPPSPSMNFGGVLQTGSSTVLPPRHGLDLMILHPSRGPGDRPVTSYQGLSGGGLWRVFCKERSPRVYDFHEACLIGVAFREGALERGKRKIKCHGPLSVYQNLFEMVTATRR